MKTAIVVVQVNGFTKTWKQINELSLENGSRLWYIQDVLVHRPSSEYKYYIGLPLCYTKLIDCFLWIFYVLLRA